MWDDPIALQRLTRLILMAVLLFTLWVAGRAMLDSTFPFREVSIQSTQTHKSTASLHSNTISGVKSFIPKMTGGFFSMDLGSTRAEIQALPWVRNVDVRRYWPGQLVINIEEHQAAAAWNDRAMLNTHGEVFQVEPSGRLAMQLPRLYAPDGMEKLVARRFSEFVHVVKPASLNVEQIVVTARQSWRVRLSDQAEKNSDKDVEISPEKPSSALFNSMTVELGRERINERLERFARAYPQAVAAVGPLRRIDMRYPNGFAAQPVTKTAGQTASVNKARKA